MSRIQLSLRAASGRFRSAVGLSQSALLIALAAAVMLCGAVALRPPRSEPAPVRAASEVQSPVKKPVAIFWGDSYFNGSSPVSATQAFGYLAGTRLGYRTVVGGHGGTGFVARRTVAPATPNYIGQVNRGGLNVSVGTPELVVIQGGLLDQRYGEPIVRSAVEEMVSAVRGVYPRAKLALVGPANPYPTAMPGILRANAVISGVAAKQRVPFVDILGLMPRTELGRYLGRDRIHPAAVGHRILAQRLANVLRSYGVAARSPADHVIVGASGGRPVAVVVGDSYAGAEAASSPSGSYGDILAQRLGWGLASVLSSRGGGYVRTGSRGTLEQMVSAKGFAGYTPDVILVQAGINDRNHDVGAIGRAATKLFLTLRAAAPAAKVIVIGVLPPTSATTRDSKYQDINAVLGGIAADSGAVFLDPLFPLLRYSVGPDRLHPSAQGHVAIANWAAQQLTARWSLSSAHTARR